MIDPLKDVKQKHMKQSSELQPTEINPDQFKEQTKTMYWKAIVLKCSLYGPPVCS